MNAMRTFKRYIFNPNDNCQYVLKIFDAQRNAIPELSHPSTKIYDVSLTGLSLITEAPLRFASHDAAAKMLIGIKLHGEYYFCDGVKVFEEKLILQSREGGMGNSGHSIPLPSTPCYRSGISISFRKRTLWEKWICLIEEVAQAQRLERMKTLPALPAIQMSELHPTSLMLFNTNTAHKP
jgi:hypothetical protein